MPGLSAFILAERFSEDGCKKTAAKQRRRTPMVKYQTMRVGGRKICRRVRHGNRGKEEAPRRSKRVCTATAQVANRFGKCA